MSGEKIVGLIVCAFLFVFTTVRMIIDFKCMHDSFKEENEKSEVD